MSYLFVITKKAKKINQIIKTSIPAKKDSNKISCNSFEEITLLLLSTNILTYTQLQSK